MTSTDTLADVPVDETLLRSLLKEQHPDLADLEVGPVFRGWDNELWRLGEELAVRLPRTPRAPELLAKEYRWLPVLAPRLPLPVPTPVRLGQAVLALPRRLDRGRVGPRRPGRPRPGHPRRPRGRRPRGLPARPAPPGARRRTGQPGPGVPLATFASRVEQTLRTTDFGEFATDDIREVWEAGLAAPVRQEPALWLHGDLHPANVVVADGTLTGVVDFGELCAGDPATDLSAAWMLLPDGAAARFLEAYGTHDTALITRARAWATARAFGLIAIGQAGDQGLPGGKPTWGPAGWATLRRVLADTAT